MSTNDAQTTESVRPCERCGKPLCALAATTTAATMTGWKDEHRG